MKPILISLSILALVGCKREIFDDLTPKELATPYILAVRGSNSSFEGKALIYPLAVGSDLFQGNYSGKPAILSSQPASYTFSPTGTVTASPQLLMPIGQYSLLYWGVPTYVDTLYGAPSGQGPVIAIDNAMSNKQIMLAKKRTDTAFMPTFDYMYALNNVNFGQDTISVKFNRVVAGLKVIVSTTDNAPFDATITSIAVQVGEISEALNYYTAAPQGAKVTVQIPLTMTADRMSASNLTALVFPSSDNPPFNIIVTYNNGTTHIERTKLDNALTANRRLVLDVKITTIKVSPEIGRFQIDNWVEGNETIEL